MNPRIELVFDEDCPNVEGWRATLAAALREIGRPASWTEWNRADPSAPAYAAALGSPSVLINGRDLFPGAPAAGSSCRVYPGQSNDLVGVPARGTMIEALHAAFASAGGTARSAKFSRLGTLGASSTAAGAALVSAAASVCCVGPISALAIISVLGASGAIWMARLAPFRPYILAGAASLLIYGFWSMYGARRACAPEGAASRWPRRLLTGMLWISALLWVGALALTLIFT